MTALHAGDNEGLLFVNQRIRTPLAVSGEAAVFQVVAREALVPSGVSVFDNGKGGVGEAAHRHRIRVQPGGGADGSVAKKSRATSGRSTRLFR